MFAGCDDDLDAGDADRAAAGQPIKRVRENGWVRQNPPLTSPSSATTTTSAPPIPPRGPRQHQGNFLTSSSEFEKTPRLVHILNVEIPSNPDLKYFYLLSSFQYSLKLIKFAGDWIQTAEPLPTEPQLLLYTIQFIGSPT